MMRRPICGVRSHALRPRPSGACLPKLTASAFPKAALYRWLAAVWLPASFGTAAPTIVGGSHDPLLEWTLREAARGWQPSGGREAGLERCAKSHRGRYSMHRSTATTRPPHRSVANARVCTRIVILSALREQGLGRALQSARLELYCRIGAQSALHWRPRAVAQLLCSPAARSASPRRARDVKPSSAVPDMRRRPPDRPTADRDAFGRRAGGLGSFR